MGWMVGGSVIAVCTLPEPTGGSNRSGVTVVDVTMSGASRPKGQPVRSAGIFVNEVRNPGSGSRRNVGESGSVAPPVLGMRIGAQWCRGVQFASGSIRSAHARGFNHRACLCRCAHA